MLLTVAPIFRIFPKKILCCLYWVKTKSKALPLFGALRLLIQKTGGQARTPDSSQRDVPVCVAFLQGVLTVPVACLAK